MRFADKMFELAMNLTTNFAGQKKEIAGHLIIVREGAVDIINKSCRANKSIDLTNKEVKNINGAWDMLTVNKLLVQF